MWIPKRFRQGSGNAAIPTSPETPMFPPPTAEELRIAAVIVDSFVAGARQCPYATFDTVRTLPGIVIFVSPKQGIMRAISIAHEVVLRLQAARYPGVTLLDDPHHLPHKVWVPARTTD